MYLGTTTMCSNFMCIFFVLSLHPVKKIVALNVFQVFFFSPPGNSKHGAAQSRKHSHWFEECCILFTEVIWECVMLFCNIIYKKKLVNVNFETVAGGMGA